MNKISVVMCTYNVETYIAEAIDSVLNQSFDDFEFIIVDDGSEDGTLPIICSYSDARINLIKNKHDYIGSLNIGLKTAIGKYIARMDADDIMHPDRLKVQHRLMEQHTAIDILGSWIEVFGDNIRSHVTGTLYGFIQYPLFKLLRGNILFHPTIMIRKSFLEAHNLQYESYAHAEDYKLWVDSAIQGACFYIEPQALNYYRVSDRQVTQKRRLKQEETSRTIRLLVAQELIRCDEESKILTDLWNIHQELILKKKLNQESSMQFIASLLEQKR